MKVFFPVLLMIAGACGFCEVANRKEPRAPTALERQLHAWHARIRATPKVWIVHDGVWHSREASPAKAKLSDEQIEANEQVINGWLARGDK